MKDGNLRDFLQKKLLKKLLKSRRYDFLKIMLSFNFCTFFGNKENIEKKHNFQKIISSHFKIFFNNFFCKKSLRFPSFKIAVAWKNPSYTRFLAKFENKEKWAFWVQTSNGYISDKTCDFSIIFFTKNSPDYQQSNV